MTDTVQVVLLVGALAAAFFAVIRVLFLDSDASKADIRIYRLEDRVSCLQGESNDNCIQIGELNKKFYESAGGLWKTASGYLMRIRDMSDNHIANSLKMPGLSSNNKIAFLAEQNRRKEDASWIARTERRGRPWSTGDFKTPPGTVGEVMEIWRNAHAASETIAAEKATAVAEKTKAADDVTIRLIQGDKDRASLQALKAAILSAVDENPRRTIKSIYKELHGDGLL